MHQVASSQFIIKVLLIGLAYYAGAWLGVTQTITPEGIAILWPPNAVLLSAFLLLPYRQWPWIAAAAMLAECIADVPAFPLWAALSFGLVNLFETALAAWLIRRSVGPWFDFDRLRRGGYFLLYGPLLGSSLAALFGAGIYILLGRTDSTYWSLWRLWWFGDALGLLVLTPVIVLLWRWLAHGLPRIEWAKLLELLLLWSLMVALGTYAFPQGVQGDLGFHLTPILLLPFSLWAAARFDVRGAALTVAIIAAMAVVFMVRGIHPYTEFSPQLAVWLMQEYLAIVAVTTIGLAILLHEIARQKAGLERRVRERTAELQRSNEALAKANQQLQEMASTDYLTGIANRRYFYDIAGRTMERMASENNPVSLLIFDLDHFKQINDSFGHDVGDEVLSTAVKAAQGAIRPLDLFARFGGEEFVIMLFGANEENAVMVAERVRRAIAAVRLDRQGEGIRPTVSIGVSQWDGHDSTDALIRKADAALYRAKSAGRNCVQAASRV